MTIRFAVAGFAVDVPCYQWGYTAGTRHAERTPFVTDHGAVHRLYLPPSPVTARSLQVRFEATLDVIEGLRWVAVLAYRGAARVQFFPDVADLGTFWWLDWQEETSVTRLIENRQSVSLTLTEQAA